jgi:hypothetical protein
VDAVRVRRTSKYDSFDSRSASVLNVSEIRELKEESTTTSNDSVIYKWFGAEETSVWLQDFGFKHLFLWHEVAISAPEITSLLQENIALELGEEASWNAEQLSAATLQSVVLPACEMVKQMDGVGFYNHNEINPSIPVAPTKQKEGEPYSYW